MIAEIALMVEQEKLKMLENNQFLHIREESGGITFQLREYSSGRRIKLTVCKHITLWELERSRLTHADQIEFLLELMSEELENYKKLNFRGEVENYAIE